MRSLCSSPGWAVLCKCFPIWWAWSAAAYSTFVWHSALLSPGFLIQYPGKSSTRGNLALVLWPLCWLPPCPLPVAVLRQDALGIGQYQFREMQKWFCGFLLCFILYSEQGSSQFREIMKWVSVFLVFLIKFSNWHILKS